MAGLTEQERAKRAKMVARFNAIKNTSSSNSSVGAEQQQQDRSVPLSFSDEESRNDVSVVGVESSGGSLESSSGGRDDHVSVERREEPPRDGFESVTVSSSFSFVHDVEVENTSVNVVPTVSNTKTLAPSTPSSLAATSSAPSPAPTLLPTTTSLLGTTTAPRTTKGRAKTIADAKKKLAAARMLSASKTDYFANSSKHYQSRDKEVLSMISSALSEESGEEGRMIEEKKKANVKGAMTMDQTKKEEVTVVGESVENERVMGRTPTRVDRLARLRSRSPALTPRSILGASRYCVANNKSVGEEGKTSVRDKAINLRHFSARTPDVPLPPSTSSTKAKIDNVVHKSDVPLTPSRMTKMKSQRECYLRMIAAADKSKKRGVISQVQSFQSLSQSSSSMESKEVIPAAMSRADSADASFDVVTSQSECSDPPLVNNLTVSTSGDTHSSVLGYVEEDGVDGANQQPLAEEKCSGGIQLSQEKEGEWPDEAFSPSSWGSQASFEDAMPEGDSTGWTKTAVVAPKIEEWDKDENVSAVRWDNASDEVSSMWNNVEEGAEEHYIESQNNNEAASLQYEGFGTATDAESCMESGDESVSYTEHEELMVQSGVSEGTPTGTATEFDVAFEECESVSPEVNAGYDEEDSFPDGATEGGIDTSSAISWASPKLLITADSKSTVFASLNGGAQMDISMTSYGHHQSSSKTPFNDSFERDGVIADSPTGTESLESWWRSRYASTQNNDINAAVQDALMKRVAPHEQRSDVPTQRSTSSSRCTSTEYTSSEQSTNVVSKDPLSANSKRSKRSFQKQVLRSPLSDEDDDTIFSGLDDDSLPSQSLKRLPSASSNALRQKRAGSTVRRGSSGSIINDNETDDDIFAGVSVSSQQKHQRVMKSLIDGTSTAESLSLLQSTKNSAKESDMRPIKNEQKNKPPGLFLPDGGYGFIDLHDMDRNSPAGASITSDITSSVIFGGDTAKKALFRKPSLTGRDFDRISESPNEASRISSMVNSTTLLSQRDELKDDDLFVKTHQEDGEKANPQTDLSEHLLSPKQFSKDASRVRSLMSPSTTDETTQQSHPSLLKKAYLMATSQQDESAADTISESVNKANTSFLSQFACGVISASSFAFCATTTGTCNVLNA
eukprot:scaffold759_cov290-Alexandrium_tamarense.AAC.46